MAERGKLESAPWMARETGSQPALATQVASRTQAWIPWLHSVSAMGPSSASTISATVIRSAGRARP